MARTTYLPAPSTSGYTERREATFDDNGNLKQVLIFVDWADGTTHHETINLAGPPDYTFSVSGALTYPDGSRTTVTVPPDGTFVIAHDWDYASPPDAIFDNRNGTDTWVFNADGTGVVTSVVESDNGMSFGITKEWHPFDADGGFAGEEHIVSTQTEHGTGVQTTIETTIDLDGKRTQHTTVQDADGTLIADDTLVTFTNPPVEPGPVRGISRPRGKTQGKDRPPPEGPQEVTVETLTAAGSAGGICGLPRSVSRGTAGAGGQLCEHYTDYYVVTKVLVEGKKQAALGSTYLGSRYLGIGAC